MDFAVFRSCADAKQRGRETDGVYVVDADGAGPGEAQSVWCDQTIDGGGWTLVGSTSGGTLNDQRADWYAAVWRDVRRALGHARPIREYQAKYKLLIAEKKRLRALRPAFVDPVETRAPAVAAPDDGTRVEEF